MKGYQRDNRGTTLAELLVALAVSAVILTGITYMLVTSLRVSGKNNAGVEVQSEIQTTLNLIMDQIMEAEGICMRISPGGDTKCILFGDTVVKKAGSNYTMHYKGKAFVADTGAGGSGELYLAEFPNEAFPADGEGYCELGNASSELGCVQKSLDETVTYLASLTAKERLRWLLGRNVVSCQILPESVYGEKTVKVNGVEQIRPLFEEPFTLTVKLKVESEYGDGTVEREVSDLASVRSRMEKVYLTKPGEAENNMEIYERER